MQTVFLLHWQGQRPTKEELQMALEDYIGTGGVRGSIAEVRKTDVGIVINIQGRSSHPLKRIGKPKFSPNDLTVARTFRVLWNENGFELSCMDKSDPITIAIMQGFARFCLAYWEMRAQE